MLNRITVLSALFLYCAFTFAQDRPKVGLVLSGGGAKGFAHVGVIKVLEEVGIPIDYVGGTSIGSIIGGLYAVGYDAKTMEKIIRDQDWSFILSDQIDRGYIPFFEKQEMDRYHVSLPFNEFKLEVPNSFIKGQNIINTFTQLTYGYHDVSDFNKLPTPYLCVAADLVTGKEVVLNKGFLPFCMKASMAIPGVFKPQEIDGKLLVDGGVINNFPVDRVEEMGADIIIGIDLSTGMRDKDELTSIGSVMNQLISVMGIRKYEENLKKCDIYINPDLHEFGASSFSHQAADTMIMRGEEAARAIMSQLIELRDLLGYEAPKKHAFKIPNADTAMYLRQIVFEGDFRGDEAYLKGKLGLKRQTYVTLEDINQGISNIYGTLNYELASYRITGDTEKTLFIYLQESARNTFNLGAHYDNVNHAALLINTTFRQGTGSGARLSANLKLSRLPGFELEYTIDRGAKPGFQTFMDWRKTNFKVITETADYLVDQNTYKFGIGTHTVMKNKFTLGVEAFYQGGSVEDVYSNADTLISDQLYVTEKNIIYGLFLDYDNLDNIYYPTQGARFNANFRVATDNFISYKDQFPLLYFTLSYQKAIKANKHLTFHPSIYARSVYWDNEVPYLFRTYVGGNKQTDYFDVQVPFYGMRFMSFSTIHSGVASLVADYQFMDKHHFGLIANAGLYSNAVDPRDNSGILYGGGLNYSYNSFAGPIDLWLTASNKQNDLYTFVSVGYWF